MRMTRRGLLQGAGALGAAALLGGCDTASSGGGGGGGGGAGGPLTWWDHTPNLQAANERIFARFTEESGTPVEYSYHQTNEMGEALQIANQSDQLPDVLTNVGLRLPVPALIDEGWFQAGAFPEEALSRLPETSLIEGIHTFDGKVYSFPVFADRQYWAITWYNTEMLEAAGVEPPTTYDEYRAVARAVQDSTPEETSGVIFNLGQRPRVAEHVNFLAQAAGFPGFGGDMYQTGEVQFHHEAYLTVIEFLLSLQQDGLLYPASGQLADAEARVRWAAGGAGLYMDGPWCPGSLGTSNAEEFLPKLGVAQMVKPDAGTELAAYRAPQGGMYWISGASQNVEAASQLIGYQTEEPYYIDIANGMAQPPLDVSVIEKADVHPAWAEMVGWFQDQVYLAPSPSAKNPRISAVNAMATAIEPDLGMIVQGAFSGDVPDWQGALKELSDKVMAQREENVAAVQAEGVEVSMDDWAFPDWEPRQDYTPEMYS
ncbi:ABC transporter substrate-binding protein [Pseudactinotalea terrae]|uniref:ABC transporter substrate-binding protein n=1 Tax=Pseudactinotalea terrae TaxID=1743262 RepID=UPI0012E20765|nr:extracellular solute-binding protein [Pseudactinotalea terrae]